MTRRRSQLALTAISLILGMLLVVQFRAQTRMAKTLLAESASDQATIISNLIEANAKLRDEVEKLEYAVNGYEHDSSSGGASLDSLEADLAALRIISGQAEVSGRGVEIRVDGNVTVVELQDMINELRNAGAEAIGLNGLRVVGRSAVTSDPNRNIQLDGMPVSPPYLFEAIGEPETIERALERKGGLVSLLRYNYSNLAVRVTKRDRLVLPVFKGVDAFSYAKQVPNN